MFQRDHTTKKYPASKRLAIVFSTIKVLSIEPNFFSSELLASSLSPYAPVSCGFSQATSSMTISKLPCRTLLISSLQELIRSHFPAGLSGLMPLVTLLTTAP